MGKQLPQKPRQIFINKVICLKCIDFLHCVTYNVTAIGKYSHTFNVCTLRIDKVKAQLVWRSKMAGHGTPTSAVSQLMDLDIWTHTFHFHFFNDEAN